MPARMAAALLQIDLVFSRPQTTLAVTRGAALIGVAGTHGKSTTSGWLLHLLTLAGLDPSGFVGALLPRALVGGPRPSTVRLGGGRYFVVEADESDASFLNLLPIMAVGVAVANAILLVTFAERARVAAGVSPAVEGGILPPGQPSEV